MATTDNTADSINGCADQLFKIGCAWTLLTILIGLLLMVFIF
jgi:hypothetical protein